MEKVGDSLGDTTPEGIHILIQAGRLYRNNLKNREFDKEAAQIFRSGASDHCRMARRE